MWVVQLSGNLCKVQGTWTRLRVLNAQRIDNSDRVLEVRRSTKRRPPSQMKLKAKLVRLIWLQAYIRYQQQQKALFARQALMMMSSKQTIIWFHHLSQRIRREISLKTSLNRSSGKSLTQSSSQPRKKWISDLIDILKNRKRDKVIREGTARMLHASCSRSAA